jgi:hypothetical protein
VENMLSNGTSALTRPPKCGWQSTMNKFTTWKKGFFDKELVKPSIQSGIKQSVDITTIPRL